MSTLIKTIIEIYKELDIPPLTIKDINEFEKYEPPHLDKLEDKIKNMLKIDTEIKNLNIDHLNPESKKEFEILKKNLGHLQVLSLLNKINNNIKNDILEITTDNIYIKFRSIIESILIGMEESITQSSQELQQSSPQQSSLTGGRLKLNENIIDEIKYNKYLKYKNKYILLKIIKLVTL